MAEQQAKRPWHQRVRRGYRAAWLPGLLVAGIGATFLLSPWPSALLIRAVFDYGGSQANRALAQRVPPGVVSLQDQRYDPADADARFDLYRPQQALDGGRPLPVVVWMHGGGFVGGTRRHVENYARMLAAQGYAVAAVGYSLAPGQHYPRPLLQLNRALGYLQAHAGALQLDMQRVALAGDSAGAQLAAQMAVVVSDPAYARWMQLQPAIGADQLRATVLFCGPYDALAMARDVNTSWFVHTVVWSYFGSRKPDLEAVAQFSVAGAVTAAFPPTFISVGNDDPLQAQSYAMARALQRQGVPLRTLFFSDQPALALPHEYQFDLQLPQARQAFAGLSDFLRQRLASPP
ncbi:alpha/beta hydrolase [Stenotrophomonas sp. YIM B06876]|uniref:alpha/beta hydrolase n=1 Tax=Stenotrophomonas sp. YIM B06876 TaxID=3060211 RepID=UPI00273A3F7F|nr:alpha/beta hydrolase [Stenotrophomonas sp. YIM B06876]